MPVTDVTTDTDNFSITITARYQAPIEQVWDVYANPRKLERVWGPPDAPATVVDHDMVEGGRVTYFMTDPDGKKYYGYWDVTAVDEPTSFSIDDGFADENFSPDAYLPVGHSTFTFAPEGEVTVVRAITYYEHEDELRQVLDMGVEEGATAAMNQIDALLAEDD